MRFTDKINLPYDENYGYTYLVMGSSRSGKTTFLLHLLDKFHKKNTINIFFVSNMNNAIYDDLKHPEDYIITYYHPEIIKMAHDINKNNGNKFKFNIIFDDVVNIKNDKEVMKALTIYRNSNISTFLLIQSPILLNSVARTNINYLFFFRFNSDEMIEIVIKKYLNTWLKGRLLDKMKEYKDLTDNHKYIFIDNLEDNIVNSKLKL